MCVKLDFLSHICSITVEISSKISSFFGGGSSEEEAASTPPQGEATDEEKVTSESTTDQPIPEDDKQGLNEPKAIYQLHTYNIMLLFIKKNYYFILFCSLKITDCLIFLTHTCLKYH